MTDKNLNGELEKLSYALGLSIAGNLIQSGVKTIQPELFLSAITDAFGGKQPLLSANEANQILENYFTKINQASQNKNAEEGTKFLEENSTKDDVTVLASGLQYSVIKEGNGAKPQASSQVKCHYHGTLIDGTVFDSSVDRGQPAVFPVNGVIKGWVEALQLMNEGSKWRLFIPPELAYGEQGAGGSIGPNTTLIFDVELLEIL